MYPELVVETDKETVEESVARIFARLVELGYLEPGFLSQSKAVPDQSGDKLTPLPTRG